MTDTTITEPIALMRLRHGDTFTFRGTEYVLVEHKRAKSSIATIGDGAIKVYTLSMSAKVTKTGHDQVALRLALVALYPPVTFKPGDTVRIVTNARTTRAGIAGKEAIVVRLNTKTVALSNGYRISPAWLEAV